MRDALLAHARVLVVPSPYESLSIALLEAWNHGVPALVNARCRGAEGASPPRQRRTAITDPSTNSATRSTIWPRTLHERRALGAQGLRFVEREYRWPTVLPTSGRAAQKLTDGAGIGGGVALGLTNRPERAAPSPIVHATYSTAIPAACVIQPNGVIHPGPTEITCADNREPCDDDEADQEIGDERG